MSKDEGQNYLDGAAGNPFARGAGQIGYQNFQAAQKWRQSTPSVRSASSRGVSGGYGSSVFDELVGFSDWIFEPVEEYFQTHLPRWMEVAFRLMSACFCAYYGAWAFISERYSVVELFSFPLSSEAGAFWILAGLIWVVVYAIALWVLELCYYLFRVGLGVVLLLIVLAAIVAAVYGVAYSIDFFT
ncbi:hypothetical protein [uncultured Sulfitobacter sp.]|uniref:hypothetical protein n=1 Tax=uncultured Sulfitobacter sp. TaxID=191468 RepID=UPI00262F599D|nr:hypothetical protein [uncultured Sulfitobacter sp.]